MKKKAMQSTQLIRIGFAIGKISFVKNVQVSQQNSIDCSSSSICIYSVIPGPISNSGICTTKNGVSRLLRRGSFEKTFICLNKLIDLICSDCHYFQVSESIWKYLYSRYGGGPELIIRSNSSLNIDEQISVN